MNLFDELQKCDGRIRKSRPQLESKLCKLQWGEIRSKDHKSYGSAAKPYGTLYTHVVQCIYTRGTLDTHMRYPVYTHVVPCIYTCGTLYVHKMTSGDGYHEHDQLWVTKDGDNIDRNGIIFMNEQYYAMIHLFLYKSLCLKLFFLIQSNLQMPLWSLSHSNWIDDDLCNQCRSLLTL